MPEIPAGRLPAGPTGLGTSAARLMRGEDTRSYLAGQAVGLAMRGSTRPPGQSAAGADDRFPKLYCPAPIRIDEALGEEVNERLLAWAEEVGIYARRLDGFRGAGFG